MPIFERGDVRIHYTVQGPAHGPVVLLIAPGGMKSAIGWWNKVAYNPLKELDGFRVVAMDQRNAGQSWGPISAADGWQTYTGDQLALLDHLGVDRFSVLGMCIGGPYAVGLVHAAPHRVESVVLFQPIGVNDNRQAFYDMFDAWRADIEADHPEANDADWSGFRSHMYDGEFLFNGTREEVAHLPAPLLLFMGDDLYHPQAISREIAELAPDVTFVEQWKGDRAATAGCVRAFLHERTGGGATSGA